MDPYERWDDWEWEKALQEVSRERGYRDQRRSSTLPPQTNRQRLGGLFNQWNSLQRRTLLAGVLLITLVVSARHTDSLSQGVYALYKGAMAPNYYTTLNGMAQDVLQISRNAQGDLAVDARMVGKLMAPVSGQVMAPFGAADPVTQSKHAGIDVNSALGVKVVAPYSGVVRAVAQDAQLGNTVQLDLGDGWTCLLGNLGDVYVVEKQRVLQGEFIGSVGLSAALKKPWLHLELRCNQQPVDPMPYLIRPAAKQ
ncbi:MAG: M23 family metallopeptidase [Peptococcaceae bacterium]|jgi:murein DD-endopeptidase MepM/ murein hydrolase activator NlpD|nr:M23 family metallopeptidase [Peptococcaceae bacterium]